MRQYEPFAGLLVCVMSRFAVVRASQPSEAVNVAADGIEESAVPVPAVLGADSDAGVGAGMSRGLVDALLGPRLVHRVRLARVAAERLVAKSSMWPVD